MTAMRPFFSVAIRHDFFGGRRAAVEWEPTDSTRRLLDASGCAVVPGHGDLEVFYDNDRRDRLGRYLDGARTPFKLDWRWRVPGFDLAYISAEGFTLPPVVSFQLASGDIPAPDAKEGKHHVVHIGVRATYWKYFLPAAWPAASVRIVDSAGQETFTAASAETLADGRAVLCVRSQRPIALAQRPRSSFRLTCVEDGIEQVVVDRLPAAAPGPFVRETAADGVVAVSEIHV